MQHLIQCQFLLEDQIIPVNDNAVDKSDQLACIRYQNQNILAMSHGSPFWVLVQMLNLRMLQIEEGKFSVFTAKILKTAEFKRTKKRFMLTEIAKRIIEI